MYGSSKATGSIQKTQSSPLRDRNATGKTVETVWTVDDFEDNLVGNGELCCTEFSSLKERPVRLRHRVFLSSCLPLTRPPTLTTTPLIVRYFLPPIPTTPLFSKAKNSPVPPLSYRLLKQQKGFMHTSSRHSYINFTHPCP